MTRQGKLGVKKKRDPRLLAFGVALAAIYSWVAIAGGCGGATWPTNGKLPAGVVERLHECGKKGPTPLRAVKFDLTYTLHVTEDDREAWVDDVMLINSTLNVPDVEECMADALRGMRTPLEALALRQHKGFDPTPVSPHSRALLGQTQAIQLLELMVAIGVGYALYTVYVHVIVDKGRSKPKPPSITDAPVEPVETAMPMATVAPTTVPVTTVMPIATAVPTATAVPIATYVPMTPNKKYEKECAAQRQRCLEKPSQPAWNRADFGNIKNCGECFRECKTHAKGLWPFYKCPAD